MTSGALLQAVCAEPPRYTDDVPSVNPLLAVKSRAPDVWVKVWLTPPGSPLVTVRESQTSDPLTVAFVRTFNSEVVRTFVVMIPAHDMIELACRRLLTVRAPFTVRAPPVIVPLGIEMLALNLSCWPDRLYVKLSSYATVVTCVGLYDVKVPPALT